MELPKGRSPSGHGTGFENACRELVEETGHAFPDDADIRQEVWYSHGGNIRWFCVVADRLVVINRFDEDTGVVALVPVSALQPHDGAGFPIRDDMKRIAAAIWRRVRQPPR